MTSSRIDFRKRASSLCGRDAPELVYSKRTPNNYQRSHQWDGWVLAVFSSLLSLSQSSRRRTIELYIRHQ